MTLFSFGISLVGMMAGLVLLVFGLIKKKKLKGGIVLGVSVVLFFASLLMPAPEGSKEKVEVASKTQEELDKEKEAKQVKKEAEEKAKEEAQKEEERIAKEAKQKAEEAKLKEENNNKHIVEQKQPVTPVKVQTEDNTNNIRKNEIEKTIKNIVESDLSNTDIKSIKINNYQLEDDKYIVLANLKWNTQNGKKTTKQMLEMFSENLTAKLYDDTSIVEVVVIWEVPYHLENANVAKYTYTRAPSGGMDKIDNWIDSILN